MRWFEQAASTIRCSIIQLHCPVKLKLIRKYKKMSLHSRIFFPNMREFFILILKRKDVPVLDSGNCHSCMKRMMAVYDIGDRQSLPVT